MRPSPYRCIRRVCQRPALHFVTSKEARSGTISTSDANDPMAIISMLFLFVKQSAFICRTFIKNGSGKGRNGCTKFLPRLSSYSPRHSVAARTPCHAARVLCHASKSSEYAKSRPFYATSGFLIYTLFTPFPASDRRSSPPLHRRGRTVPCSPSL